MYLPTWNSLRGHPVPQWFKDAKFGIYTHWGIYSVPARGPNATWYPYNMYRPGTDQHRYHCSTYGDPAVFGYKNFIPMFKAEKFDPDAWAEVFKDSGAQYAGPVAEHHDGFAMWDSQHTEWSAAKMGPKRDVVGLLAQAIRKQSLRFLTAFHHAENWWFYPHWEKRYDTADPRYAGLYGPPHDMEGPQGSGFFDQARPDKTFLDRWKAKMVEVVEKYQPDLIWYDFGLGAAPEAYKQDFLAYYYNQAEARGREVVVTYKNDDLAPESGVVDLELGRMKDLTYYPWITDSTVDDGEGWGYLKETGYKSTTALIHYLIDNVSKNGHLLLNVGPKPDGTLPDQAVAILKGMGDWLRVNGEAIYGTTPWVKYGEGPNQIERGGAFNEKDVPTFTAQDIRFTAKDSTLYAICLGWPGEQVTIESLKRLYPGEIRSIHLLGNGKTLTWRATGQGVVVYLPREKPCEHAFTLRIERGQPYA